MGMDAIGHVQKRFFEDFPAHEQEPVYGFVTQSTLKATQISCTPGEWVGCVHAHCIVK
jgi:hypothetical protein